MEYVIAAVIIASFIGLYLWSYSVNQKCDKPEGVEAIDCEGCHASNCKERKNEHQ